MKIMNALGKLISPSQHWHEDYRQFLDDVLRPSELTYGQFAEKGYLKGPDKYRKYTDKGFRTATGKVELKLSSAEKFGLSALPNWKGLPEEEHRDFPLVLTSSKSRYFLHSSYRWIEKLRQKQPHPRVEIHPETADKYGIQQGDSVIIETKFGSMTQVAHVTDKVGPRIINASHGWWFPEGEAENQYGWKTSNFNMLTSIEKLGKEFGTPNLKGIGCRIRPDRPST
jgi:anaerobic selenocysteine-containing dehydrogenase